MKHYPSYDSVGLPCPVCHSVLLNVKETRAHRGYIRRLRSCTRCDFRFYTVEMWSDIQCQPTGGEQEAAAEGFLPEVAA